MPKGKGGKGGRGGSAPRFNRQVPKFLQQYAHLLGAERPDPHGNDDMSFQSTAIEEGYDSDGDQVVGNFLKEREKEKRDKLEAEAAEAEAIARAEAEAREGTSFPTEEPTGPPKVIFRAAPKKRSTDEDQAAPVSSDGEAAAAPKAGRKKRKKKKLDNKKLLSFETEDA